MDLAKQFFYQAKVGPERPAVVFTGGVATYEILARAVRSASERLRLEGLERGRIVAVDVRNPFHHIALLLALATRGIPSVSVQTTFSIALSGLPVAAIVADRYAQSGSGIRGIPIDEGWFDGRDPGANFEYLGFANEEDVVRIVLSSGTTGTPKAVALDGKLLERRMMRGSFVIGGASLYGVISLMGFSTLGGFSSAMGALCTGGITCHAPSPEDTLQLIRLFSITHLVVSPIQLQTLLERARGQPCPSLRYVYIAGSRIPQSLVRDALTGLCSNVVLAYGSTEAGGAAMVRASEVLGLDGVGGYVLPWVEVEILDAEGNPLPPGREGIIRVRSDELAPYFASALEDREIVRDGWFYPGDVGSIRSDGLVIIHGRAAELINRGGSKVAPEVVEQVLLTRPEIADAAAFGKVNAKGVEEIWAAVVPIGALDQDDILRYCRDRLADKTPDKILVVTKIPRNDMGKVLRDQLRQDH